LITTYIDNKVGISENFLSDDLANKLKQNLLALNQQDLLITAGTGNSQAIVYDTPYAAILFIDNKHNDPFENQFLLQIEGSLLII
jgi:SM-20-related protein